jgi:hypothetical protein
MLEIGKQMLAFILAKVNNIEVILACDLTDGRASTAEFIYTEIHERR